MRGADPAGRELPTCFGRYDCGPARAYCCVFSLACRLDREISAVRPEEASRCREELLTIRELEVWADLARVESLNCPYCPMGATTWEQLAAHIYLEHDRGGAGALV